MPLQIPALTDDIDYFPNPNIALAEPNGLLAIGGDLNPRRLLAAYRNGIFPWYDEEPILWWSPDPRTVLFLNDIHISASLKKTLRQHPFEVTLDKQFSQVIQHCAAPRLRDGKKEVGTWITKDMQNAYIQLHQLGYAHSIEIVSQNELVGGLYGISLGRQFFGESMFSLQKNASKVALVYLAKQLSSWGFEFIDCQMWSPHLASMGATAIARSVFLAKIAANGKYETKMGRWELDPIIDI